MCICFKIFRKNSAITVDSIEGDYIIKTLKEFGYLDKNNEFNLVRPIKGLESKKEGALGYQIAKGLNHNADRPHFNKYTQFVNKYFHKMFFAVESEVYPDLPKVVEEVEIDRDLFESIKEVVVNTVPLQVVEVNSDLSKLVEEVQFHQDLQFVKEDVLYPESPEVVEVEVNSDLPKKVVEELKFDRDLLELVKDDDVNKVPLEVVEVNSGLPKVIEEVKFNQDIQFDKEDELILNLSEIDPDDIELDRDSLELEKEDEVNKVPLEVVAVSSGLPKVVEEVEFNRDLQFDKEDEVILNLSDIDMFDMQLNLDDFKLKVNGNIDIEFIDNYVDRKSVLNDSDKTPVILSKSLVTHSLDNYCTR